VGHALPDAAVSPRVSTTRRRSNMWLAAKARSANPETTRPCRFRRLAEFRVASLGDSRRRWLSSLITGTRCTLESARNTYSRPTQARPEVEESTARFAGSSQPGDAAAHTRAPWLRRAARDLRAITGGRQPQSRRDGSKLSSSHFPEWLEVPHPPVRRPGDGHASPRAWVRLEVARGWKDDGREVSGSGRRRLDGTHGRWRTRAYGRAL